jgi:hypothetical protein
MILWDEGEEHRRAAGEMILRDEGEERQDGRSYDGDLQETWSDRWRGAGEVGLEARLL